ncbi:MAG: zf-HC2 domain-containing protein [Gemmatimonadetes bacterium]|nr:zf-HC2 domain-containing protein [Gemmatimonadota bacterium]
MRPTAATLGCGDVANVLWEYLDGELDVELAAEVRAHLNACPPCRTRIGSAQAFLRAVEGVEGVDRAPDALRERIDALLRERDLQS